MNKLIRELVPFFNLPTAVNSLKVFIHNLVSIVCKFSFGLRLSIIINLSNLCYFNWCFHIGTINITFDYN